MVRMSSPITTKLSVNVNKVALLRNSRNNGLPSVVKAAQICLEAGAHGITVHPRPDARHITRADVDDLAELMRAWPDREFNIEGNPLHNLMDIVRVVRPHQVTFVPDSVGQSTSDHGWDLHVHGDTLRPLIAECQAMGVRVSLFMDAVAANMAAARALGADRVELYTGPFAEAWACGDARAALHAAADTAQRAQAAGLGVNAGHDLSQANLGDFLHAVPGVLEVSIGHALVADALELGMAEAVREYQRCIRAAAAR